MVVGLVGCGRWGRNILRDLRLLGCKVPVVARSTASIERAHEGGATSVVERIDDLSGVDGVVVATPTSTHAAVVEHALTLGVPVYCEKPLCSDATDAARLAQVAPTALFVMDKWRYHPGVQILRAIADDERLGEVQGLRTLRAGWGTAHDDVDAVWVLAPHDLAIALEVLGRLLPATAAVAQPGTRGHDALLGTMSDGAVWHVLDVSARSPDFVRRVELHCAEGVAVLAGGWDDHVTVYRNHARDLVEEQIDASAELPLLAELRAFVSHLAGGPAPKSSAEEGATIVARIAELRELAST